jgi:hypothetical protein
MAIWPASVPILDGWREQLQNRTKIDLNLLVR